jgi:hypothetical protein
MEQREYEDGLNLSGKSFRKSVAQPVPINPDGKRIVDDWKFFYNGWEEEGDDGNDGGRHRATSEDIFPESRKGELDGNLLETLGLTKERMEKGTHFSFTNSFFLCATQKCQALRTILEKLSTAR